MSKRGLPSPQVSGFGTVGIVSAITHNRPSADQTAANGRNASATGIGGRVLRFDPSHHGRETTSVDPLLKEATAIHNGCWNRVKALLGMGGDSDGLPFADFFQPCKIHLSGGMVEGRFEHHTEFTNDGEIVITYSRECFERFAAKAQTFEMPVFVPLRGAGSNRESIGKIVSVDLESELLSAVFHECAHGLCMAYQINTRPAWTIRGDDSGDSLFLGSALDAPTALEWFKKWAPQVHAKDYSKWAEGVAELVSATALLQIAAERHDPKPIRDFVAARLGMLAGYNILLTHNNMRNFCLRNLLSSFADLGDQVELINNVIDMVLKSGTSISESEKKRMAPYALGTCEILWEINKGECLREISRNPLSSTIFPLDDSF